MKCGGLLCVSGVSVRALCVCVFNVNNNVFFFLNLI